MSSQLIYRVQARLGPTSRGRQHGPGTSPVSPSPCGTQPESAPAEAPRLVIVAERGPWTTTEGAP